MLPQRIVSFKYRAIQVRMRTQLMKRQEANSLDNITWSELGEQKPTNQKRLLNFLTHVQLPLSKCTHTPKRFFETRAELFPC